MSAKKSLSFVTPNEHTAKMWSLGLNHVRRGLQSLLPRLQLELYPFDSVFLQEILHKLSAKAEARRCCSRPSSPLTLYVCAHEVKHKPHCVWVFRQKFASLSVATCSSKVAQITPTTAAAESAEHNFQFELCSGIPLSSTCQLRSFLKLVTSVGRFDRELRVR